MAHAGFVHLRVHSAYSLSEGAIKLKDLIGLCRQAAMPAGAGPPSHQLVRALPIALLARLVQLFPGRLYVELMRNGLAIERRVEPALIELADRRVLPLVATNDVYFADAAMAEAHEALLSIAKGTLLSDPERPRLTPE